MTAFTPTAPEVSAVVGDLPTTLVRAFEWLDPVALVGQSTLTDLADDFDEEGEVAYTLDLCRNHQPDIYMELVPKLMVGISFSEFQTFVCRKFSDLLPLGMTITWLEELRQGVPIELMGIDLLDSDLYDGTTACAERKMIAKIATLFGLSEKSPTEEVYLTSNQAAALIDSLNGYRKRPYTDIAKLLEWTFSRTGNRLLDLTFEDFWENGNDLPGWQPDDMEWVATDYVQMYRAAEKHLKAVHRAVTLLNKRPDWFSALGANIASIRRTHGNKPAFKWPAKDSKPCRAAA